MTIFKFLKGHALGTVLVCIFLVLEAVFELQLPTIMSQIVDTGIQQGGIEYPVPKRIQATALTQLEMFMPKSDIDVVESSYGAANENGIRFLNKDISNKDKEATGKLGKAMVMPECAAMALKDGVDLTKVMSSAKEAQGTQTDALSSSSAPSTSPQLMSSLAPLLQDKKLDLDEVSLLYAQGIVTKDELVSAAERMNDSLGAISGSLVSQRAIAYVQDQYEEQGLNLDSIRMEYLSTTAWRMLGVCAGMGLSAIIVTYIASRIAAKIAQETRSHLFSKIMKFGATEIDKFSNASLITRTTNDVTQVQMALVMLLRMVFLAPAMTVVALIQVTLMHSGLEWTIGVAVIAIGAVMGTLFGLTMPKFKRMQSLIDRVNLIASDILNGLLPIRAYVREDYEEQRFEKASTELMKTQLFTNRAMSLSMPAIMLVMNLISLLIVWFGAQAIDSGTLQVGTMMAFISYTMEIVISFMVLAMVSIMLPRAEVSAKRITDVLDQNIAVVDPAEPRAIESSERGRLAFDDVTFFYPGADEPVIRNVSFETAPHEVTAIIGPTGSGKTTVAKLIPRLFDPTSGTITLDGVNIRDLSLNDLRSRIGYVPQQGLLFSGTIEDNIKFADKPISDKAMQEAASVAQATEFIEEKEEGYQTHVAQKGSNVSGGQRQRLSIARALAKGPEVLVLDDSFSALDYKTDAKLREALVQNEQDMAQVVVAQRVASIMHAAEIIVLDNGEVVGRGTHEELLTSCTTYLEIASSQLSPKELGMTEEEIEKRLKKPEKIAKHTEDEEIQTLEKDIKRSNAAHSKKADSKEAKGGDA